MTTDFIAQLNDKDIVSKTIFSSSVKVVESKA